MLISFIMICLMLSAVVFIHELGHFLAARFYKIPVYTFSIGFGKSLFSFKDKKDTTWQIAMIPLGGYVQMPVDALFGVKKIIVSLAGPFMNFILSYVIFFITILSFGVLTALPVIKEIEPNSLAQKYDIRIKDEIISVNDQPVTSIRKILKTNKNITLKIKRQEEPIIVKHIDITEPKLGIMFDAAVKPAAFLEAVKAPFFIIIILCKKIFENIFSWGSFKNMGGVVSIFSASNSSYQCGWSSFLFFMGMISVNLGFLNLLPIPILDGGNVALGIFEVLTKKRLSKIIYEKFVLVGVIILLSTMIIAFINDIFKVV